MYPQPATLLQGLFQAIHPAAAPAPAAIGPAEAQLLNVPATAGASMARVVLEVRQGWLRVQVDDDGVGGADPGRGSGLVGLGGRVEALGGSIAISSPSGSGTAIVAELPVPS